MKICQMAYKICQGRFKSMPNTKLTLKELPTTIKFCEISLNLVTVVRSDIFPPTNVLLGKF